MAQQQLEHVADLVQTGTTQGETIVRFERVRKAFGDLVVLDDLDFEVKAGEKLVIIGPSGSGKTTILRVLMTLERPDAGGVWVDGDYLFRVEKRGRLQRASERHVARVRTKIGMVFQHFNLFPHMSAHDNVAFAPNKVLGIPKGEAKDRAKALLESVGLGDKLDEKPSRLSGGQKQRVAIARALVTDPSILLCDEPTGALDTRTGSEVLELLGALNADGATIIMVTHDLGVAATLKRALAMRDGQIEADGPAAAVVDDIRRAELAHTEPKGGN